MYKERLPNRLVSSIKTRNVPTWAYKSFPQLSHLGAVVTVTNISNSDRMPLLKKKNRLNYFINIMYI